jgi:hypothetical protein
VEALAKAGQHPAFSCLLPVALAEGRPPPTKLTSGFFVSRHRVACHAAPAVTAHSQRVLLGVPTKPHRVGVNGHQGIRLLSWVGRTFTC